MDNDTFVEYMRISHSCVAYCAALILSHFLRCPCVFPLKTGVVSLSVLTVGVK